MGTIYASKKYLVPALTEKCRLFLDDELSEENVCLILTQAIMFDEEDLMEKCLKLIDRQTQEVFESEGFLHLDQRTLNLVLARDTLDIEEHLVFQAVERWALTECGSQNLETSPENKRKVLGEALFLVRMPLMTAEQFTNGPYESGVLKLEESVDIFANFNRKRKADIAPFPAIKECRSSSFAKDLIHLQQENGTWVVNITQMLLISQ